MVTKNKGQKASHVSKRSRQGDNCYRKEGYKRKSRLTSDCVQGCKSGYKSDRGNKAGARNLVDKHSASVGEIFESYVEDLSHDGRGVVRQRQHLNIDEQSARDHTESKIAFVSGALPGENVSWRLIDQRQSYDEGITIDIDEPSADRISPSCIYFEQCGGCELQHLSASAQLRWKEQNFKRAMLANNLAPEQWLPTLMSEDKGYRRRVRLSVAYDRRAGVRLGFKEKRSHSIVAIEHCQVLEQPLENRLKAIFELAEHMRSAKLREIEMTLADNGVLVVFYCDKLLSDSQQILAKKILPYDHMYCAEKNSSHLVCIQSPDEPLFSKINLGEHAIEFLVNPTEFIQINKTMNQKIIQQSLDLIKPVSSSRVLDLFCGSGNFSLPFAQQSSFVVGIEGLEHLAHTAAENAQRAKLDNIDFVTANLFSDTPPLAVKNNKFDVVILDPPRAGAREVAQWLSKYGAQKVLYVSCHPATMMRDLKSLMTRYRIASAGLMDMFPHTTHIEAMVLLELQP